jgi:very-short-patch-repair endonuclease
MKTTGSRKNMFYGAKGDIFEAASLMRKNMTLAELVIWSQLRNKDIFKVKFRRQHPIDVFIVDFYCHELRLAIEIDGEIHNDDKLKEYDLGRTYALQKYGIKVIRFSNQQVLCSLESVTEKILKEIREIGPL